MGENLEVVWVDFSTLSYTILQSTAWQVHTIHAASSRVENSAQVLSCQLKFVCGYELDTYMYADVLPRPLASKALMFYAKPRAANIG
jgi:hypothetical protein